MNTTATANPYYPVVQHPSLGQVGYRVSQMPTNPDSQVGQTLTMMRDKVAQAVADPGFRGWVYSRFGNLGLDPVSAVEAVWAHTRGSIHFQKDEVTGAGIGGYTADEVVEVIISPIDMAKFIDEGVAVGDCDDFSSYVAACLGVLGVPCYFKTVAADGRDPRQFSHVYVMSYPNGMPVAVDASHGPYCGWEVNGYGREHEWASGSDGKNSSRGLLEDILIGAVAVVAGAWTYGKLTGSGGGLNLGGFSWTF